MKKTTLCYIEKDDSYLMLYRNKKKVDINKNKWIGVGGHLLENETPDECLKREVYEETGLTLLEYKLRGEIIFHIDDLIETCYLYTTNKFDGEIRECNEGELHWVKKSELFDLPMWEADPLFLRKLINDEEFFRIKLVYINDKLISVEYL